MSLEILRGYTGHIRHNGIVNRFRYPVFFLKFDVKSETLLRTTLQERFYGFLDFKGSDYLLQQSGHLADEVHSFLKNKCDYAAEEISLVTMPRMLGYGFNPVSFWLCSQGGALNSVLCEVNNTFGERHFYFVKAADGKPLHEEPSPKTFHVSPFLPVTGSYRFQFKISPEHLRIDINYFGSNQELTLATWLEGRITPLAEVSFFSLLRNYGWFSLMVILRIHFQALKLFFKGARFYSKPIPPRQEVTHERSHTVDKTLSEGS